VLLTITTTRAPATDLGYLLHKHPDRFQSFAVSAGEAHVFYPEATPERCTAALLLEVDPVALVRGHGGKQADTELARYVNDRPYAASSMLAVAIKEAFRTALTGRCDARPELAAAAIPLAIRVPALRCRRSGDGATLAHRVFGPLGWSVEAAPQPFEPPEWGDSPYLDLRLTGDLRLADALNHLYVLLPVLDDAKHYWVSTEEVDKLVRAGGDWLASHPEKELITRRYLAHQRKLTQSALARLAEADDTDPSELDNAVPDPEAPETQPPQAKSLATLRREAVRAVLRTEGTRRIGDFGCGEGTLVRDLLKDSNVELVLAVDVSVRALQLAARTLNLDRMSGPQRDRLKLFQSSLLYRDDRLAGLDAAVLMEVIEHVDPGRLAALERAVFGFAAPGTVLVTTPNAEYNACFGTLPAGAMRHRDHRFEWTRAEFGGWATRVAADFGYQVRFAPVGPEHPALGPPTQLAVFTRPSTPRPATP
jgi:3' terminal RNA ribose 2'-O-methyltransferase Hen1